MAADGQIVEAASTRQSRFQLRWVLQGWRYRCQRAWSYLTRRLPYLLGRRLIAFSARESNLVAFAAREMPNSAVEGPTRWMRAHMLELTALWSCHHHSGMSNTFALQYANRLLRFKPVGPLTGEDDEWNDVADDQQQNRRCSSVFRRREDDGSWRAYDINVRVFEEPSGACYSSKDSFGDIEFPYTVPTYPEVVKVKEGEE